MARSVPSDTELEFGFNARRLSDLFELDLDTTKKLLTEVEADGERNGQPIWRLVTAAPKLVTPTGDLEAYILRMKPDDLPVKLSKEFWNAMNSRARYYEKRGDLWSTHRVYEVMTKVLSIARDTARVFVDSIESRVKLTEKQRTEFQKEMDRMLGEMRERIVEEFDDYDPNKDHGDKIEEQRDEFNNGDQFGITGSRRTEIIGGNGEEKEDDSWLDDL